MYRLILNPCSGTVEYLPPEVVSGLEYSFGFDMWTVGVLVYEMLVGESPFLASDQDSIMARIATGVFALPEWLADDAADLVSRLLRLDPSARPTAREVLEHPWITRCTAAA